MPNDKESILDRTIDRAGPDCVLMISPAAYDDVRHNTKPEDWQITPNRKTYRGALIEVHDEWSWGWNIRDRDGQFIHLKDNT